MDKKHRTWFGNFRCLLALGMSIGAFILGVQAKQIGSAKQTITVKGVAENRLIRLQPNGKLRSIRVRQLCRCAGADQSKKNRRCKIFSNSLVLTVNR